MIPIVQNELYLFKVTGITERRRFTDRNGNRRTSYNIRVVDKDGQTDTFEFVCPEADDVRTHIPGPDGSFYMEFMCVYNNVHGREIIPWDSEKKGKPQPTPTAAQPVQQPQYQHPGLNPQTHYMVASTPPPPPSAQQGQQPYQAMQSQQSPADTYTLPPTETPFSRSLDMALEIFIKDRQSSGKQSFLLSEDEVHLIFRNANTIFNKILEFQQF